MGNIEKERWLGKAYRAKCGCKVRERTIPDLMEFGEGLGITELVIVERRCPTHKSYASLTDREEASE